MTLRSFKEFVVESVIDIPRDTLSPVVFSFPETGQPKLQSSIKKQLLRDISRIDSIIPVKRFYIIGSILTRRYNDQSDIDVNVEIESNGASDEVFSNVITKVIKNLNGRLATGTTHPVNYYIMRSEYDLNNTDAAYDVLNDRWLKIAKDEDDVDLKKYINHFQKAITKMDLLTGELRRDIIDIDYYKTLPTEKIEKLKEMVDSKLKEIEYDIARLGVAKREFRELRDLAFKRDVPFSELRHVISRNWLPENISYKLFSKYHYDKLVHKLTDFLDGNKPLDVEDVEKMKRINLGLW